MLTLASALLILPVTLDARSITAGLPLPAIISEARELWQPYLDVVFRTAADPVTACDGALRLLITDQAGAAAGTRSRGNSLGWIEFVAHEQPARAITVSARSARAMIKEGRWLGRSLGTLPPRLIQTLLARALGRAIAHEIGHYVLRSTSHSSEGLMRARFGVADIMNGKRSHFRLGRDEEALLARRLAAPEWTVPVPESPENRLSARAEDDPSLTSRVSCGLD